MQLQAEINTIPLPYLDKESANDQFSNKIDDLKNRYASLVRIQGQPYPFEGSSHVPSKSNSTYHYKNAKGEIFSNDGVSWYDASGKQVGNK